MDEPDPGTVQYLFDNIRLYSGNVTYEDARIAVYNIILAGDVPGLVDKFGVPPDVADMLFAEVRCRE